MLEEVDRAEVELLRGAPSLAVEVVVLERQADQILRQQDAPVAGEVC